MTDRVNRPHRKSGPARMYERDSLSVTRRGRSATKRIQKVRIKALRAHRVDGQALVDIERRNADRPLTEKQRMFVRYWAQGETPRTACVMAGFSETSASMGWKLSHDPAILKLYHEEKQLYEAAAQVTRKRVMDMLMESYEHAKLVSEPASMVAAAREIGKMCGYYEPEKHLHLHAAGGKLFDRLNSLSDVELMKLIEQEETLLIEGKAERV